MKALLLLLLALPVYAEPATTLERNTVLQHARAKVKLNKQASGVTVCNLSLSDIIAGEWVELEAWMVATNDTKLPVGVTFEIMEWTGNSWSNLREAPNGSQRGGGNLTPQQHHGVYTTRADYLARDYVGNRAFSAIVWAYRKPSDSGYLTLDECQIRAVRHRP